MGISNDVKRRLYQHNIGRTQSTKSRRPFILVYTEIHTTREEARKREVYLKSYAGVGEKRKILESL